MALANLSANWKQLQATLNSSKKEKYAEKTSSQHGMKRKRQLSQHPAPTSLEASKPRKRLRIQKSMARHEGSAGALSVTELEKAENIPRPRFSAVAHSDKVNAGLSDNVEIGKYVAIDCEMVGIGPTPDRESALARVSVVNYTGDQVYDSYVLPLEPVTDYRTNVSGISAKHLKHARPFKEVQTDIFNIITDRVIIGHSLRHDLEALMITHPQRDIRDTARHPPYRKMAGGSSPRLKILASELLGTEIQEGEHSSIEDARACMMLFRKDKAVFEREHSKRWPARPRGESLDIADNETKPHKRKKKNKKKR